MKKLALIPGILLTLLGFFQGFRYLVDYNSLTNYGKGYVWGSLFLVATGLVFLYIGLKKKKTNG